jgi:hypothetical protein
MTKAPTLKVKLPNWDGKFNCEIYDTQGTMLYPDDVNGSSPLELIPKGINIVAIVQCGGLWFANGKFGCTWRLFQAVVQPKPTMKGKCWINVSPATKNALVASAETSMVVEDDSDEEYEPPVVAKPLPPSKPVPTIAVPPAPIEKPEPVVEVPVQAPVVQAATEPVVLKKKIVRKKE